SISILNSLFLFSSRRRHTRFSRDWSSDVCSSDLKLCAYRNVLGDADLERARPFHDLLLQANPEQLVWGSDWPHLRVTPAPDAGQIGRASCREGAWMSGGAAHLNKQRQNVCY